MTDNKITLPMDVSKGIQFDFTIEGITEEQAKNLLDAIIEQVKVINPEWDNVFAGGFVSVAHMEELERDNFCDHGENNYTCPLCNNSDPDMLDMMDDDISLEDLEEWEEEDCYTCSHGEIYDNCEICGDDALLYRRF